MEIFEYAFMQRAFIVGILLAAIIPCIGLVIVCKRLSMIGDALSHTSLAGVAAGLLLGLNPVLTAAAACVVAAIGIEAIRRKIPRFSEMSIAIIMSAGIGLAGVLSGFIKNAANFNSFLFGSIVAISNGELYLVIAVSMAVLLMFLLMYKELFYVSLDEQSARLAGVPVKTISLVVGGGSGYSVYDYGLGRCVLPGIEAGRHDCASGSIGFDTSVCRKENSEMKIII